MHAEVDETKCVLIVLLLLGVKTVIYCVCKY